MLPGAFLALVVFGFKIKLFQVFTAVGVGPFGIALAAYVSFVNFIGALH
jgi:hypothetical protein